MVNYALFYYVKKLKNILDYRHNVDLQIYNNS